MKNFILLLLSILLIFSCRQFKPRVQEIFISGKIENTSDSILTIKKNKEIYTIKIAEDGTFLDSLYDFSGGMYQLQLGNEYTDIYLQDYYNLNIYLDTENFDESIKYNGVGANENNYLARKIRNRMGVNEWNYCRLPEDSFLYYIDSFIGYQEFFIDEYALLVPELDTNLYQYEKNNNKYWNAFMKERYAETHRYFTKNDSFEVSENFYDFREKVNLENKKLLDVSYYPLYVEAYLNNKIDTKDTMEYALKMLRTIDKEIKDNKLKKEFIYRSAKQNMQYVKSLNNYWNLVSFMVTDKPKHSELKKIHRKLKKIQAGELSPMARFEDVKGETFSLEDFKGKVIYIDVWAQWCAPCKREAPYFQKLKEKYADKNIVFLQLSVDKNREAWAKYINKKEETKNSFILANAFDSEFAKSYLINGIPRFILLDKNLNIINANAMRPSNVEIENVLNTALQQQ